MLKRGKSGQFELIGVLREGGRNCGDPQILDPTTDWTEVSVHTQWIRAIMSGASPGIY